MNRWLDTRWKRLAVPAAFLAWCASATAARAATAHVQYLSSSSVYLDAGSDAGLAEGTNVRVERDGRVIAQLVVEFVAGRSAACRIASSTATIRPGDVCSFEPAVAAPEPAEPPRASAPGPPAGAPRSDPDAWPGFGAIHGNVALLYRRSSQTGSTFTNPALRADLRLNGAERRQLGLRLRADRPRVGFDSSSETSSRADELRLYEAEARYRSAGERLEAVGGRFIPRGMEMVGYVDGAAASVRAWRSLRFGVLGGRGAQPGAGGFSTGGYKLGGYLEASDARSGGPVRWRTLLGAALLEDADVTRRQFVLLRADQGFSPQVRFYENLEVDVNPGWRRALGDPAVDLTAFTVGSQFNPARAVDLMLGYDMRRDLRPPETRTSSLPPLPLPRTHGGYGALHVRLSKWTALRVGGDFRRRSDGTRITHSWDATLYGSHPALPSLQGTLHGTVYDASPGKGDLYDLSLGWLAHQRLRFDAAAGSQHSQVDATAVSSTDQRLDWLRLSADVQLGHGLWLAATGEWRDQMGSREVYAEIGQRF